MGSDALSPTLNRERTRAAFEASTDFTVGLEEEFAILDPETLDLVPRFEDLRDAAIAADPPLGEAIAGELISS
ncbi:MAG: carboxylate-amine ligase, partial [Thermoleophilia bacterium]